MENNSENRRQLLDAYLYLVDGPLEETLASDLELVTGRSYTIFPNSSESGVTNLEYRHKTPFGSISYSPSDRIVTTPLKAKKESKVKLGQIEGIIFELLIQDPEVIFSRTTLRLATWHNTTRTVNNKDERTIDRTIRVIREKIGDSPVSGSTRDKKFKIIHTIPKLGYSLTPATDEKSTQ